jgi:hypothetical protein
MSGFTFSVAGRKPVQISRWTKVLLEELVILCSVSNLKIYCRVQNGPSLDFILNYRAFSFLTSRCYYAVHVVLS